MSMAFFYASSISSVYVEIELLMANDLFLQFVTRCHKASVDHSYNITETQQLPFEHLDIPSFRTYPFDVGEG